MGVDTAVSGPRHFRAPIMLAPLPVSAPETGSHHGGSQSNYYSIRARDSLVMLPHLVSKNISLKFVFQSFFKKYKGQIFSPLLIL
jgi:hypothetical protein